VLFGVLLFAGFWNKKLGVLGALGSVATFIATITIIPFMPDGWAPSAGGFPAMVGSVAFLMKDVALLAVSFYLLKQDVIRVAQTAKHRDLVVEAVATHGPIGDSWPMALFDCPRRHRVFMETRVMKARA
jgi:hypothetical protein